VRLLLLDHSLIIPWLVRRVVPPGVEVQVTGSFSDVRRRSRRAGAICRPRGCGDRAR